MRYIMVFSKEFTAFHTPKHIITLHYFFNILMQIKRLDIICAYFV